MEFSEVCVGRRIGALKEVVFEPMQQGWLMLLRDDDDALLPFTCEGQACVFENLARASELAQLIGFNRIRVLHRITVTF
ncbi:MAG: hypothetical protein V7752_18370 [Halopseudomonas sp.]